MKRFTLIILLSLFVSSCQKEAKYSLHSTTHLIDKKGATEKDTLFRFVDVVVGGLETKIDSLNGILFNSTNLSADLEIELRNQITHNKNDLTIVKKLKDQLKIYADSETYSSKIANELNTFINYFDNGDRILNPNGNKRTTSSPDVLKYVYKKDYDRQLKIKNGLKDSLSKIHKTLKHLNNKNLKLILLNNTLNKHNSQYQKQINSYNSKLILLKDSVLKAYNKMNLPQILEDYKNISTLKVTSFDFNFISKKSKKIKLKEAKFNHKNIEKVEISFCVEIQKFTNLDLKRVYAELKGPYEIILNKRSFVLNSKIPSKDTYISKFFFREKITPIGDFYPGQYKITLYDELTLELLQQNTFELY